MRLWDVLKKDDALKDIPVIAVTAAAMKEEEEKIRKAGIQGYLRKPVSKRDLLKEIVKFLPVLEEKEQEKPLEEKKLKIKVLSEGIKGEVDELIKILEVDLMAEWELLEKRVAIKQSQRFAEEIIEKGEEYGVDILKEWGLTLIDKVRKFNKKGISKILSSYPKIVKEVTDLNV